MDKYIFFDESIDIHDEVDLLGGISLPSTLIDKMKEIDKVSLNMLSSYSFHDILKKKGEIGKRIQMQYLKWFTETVKLFSSHMRVSVLSFSALKTFKENEYYNYLVYNKLPERLIYGFLKHDSTVKKSYVRILLDSNINYTKYNMETYLMNHLNALSLYRNLNYTVQSVDIVYKNPKDVLDSKIEHLCSKYLKKSENLLVNYIRINDKNEKHIEHVVNRQTSLLRKTISDLHNITYPHKDRAKNQNSFGISLIDAVLSIVRTVLKYNSLIIDLKKVDIRTSKISSLFHKTEFVYQVLLDSTNKKLIKDVRFFDVVGGEDLVLKNIEYEIELFMTHWGEKRNEIYR